MIQIECQDEPVAGWWVGRWIDAQLELVRDPGLLGSQVVAEIGTSRAAGWASSVTIERLILSACIVLPFHRHGPLRGGTSADGNLTDALPVAEFDLVGGRCIRGSRDVGPVQGEGLSGGATEEVLHWVSEDPCHVERRIEGHVPFDLIVREVEFHEEPRKIRHRGGRVLWVTTIVTSTRTSAGK